MKSTIYYVSTHIVGTAFIIFTTIKNTVTKISQFLHFHSNSQQNSQFYEFFGPLNILFAIMLIKITSYYVSKHIVGSAFMIFITIENTVPKISQFLHFHPNSQ